jgi:hypothetical protein
MITGAAVFNQDYARVKPLTGMNMGKVKVSVLSTRTRRILNTTGIPILIDGLFGKNDVLFLEHGILDEVLSPRLAKFEDLTDWPNVEKAKEVARELNKASESNRVYYVHEFIGSHLVKLKGPNNSLDQLAFSLLAVEDYYHPAVHFQEQIRTLTKEDYDTVLNGWVYLARTAFGKLANALPLANRLEFRIILLKEFKAEVIQHPDYVKLFGMLYDYIDRRIFSKGRMLIQTAEMMHEVLDDLDKEQIADIGFIAPGQSHGDSIVVQADLFRSLFDEGKPALLRELNSEVTKNRATEDRFTHIFSRRELPLILK